MSERESSSTKGLLPPVPSGHGVVYKIKLSDKQLREVKEKGSTVIKLPEDVVELVSGGKKKEAVTKVVRPYNVRNGYVYVYCRSEGGIALRHFSADRAKRARHRMSYMKPQTGD